jgi:hypothetical protein
MNFAPRRNYRPENNLTEAAEEREEYRTVNDNEDLPF